MAFNISDLGGIPYLADTNIDLGPRQWIPDFLALAPYLLIVICIGGIFVYPLGAKAKTGKKENITRVP